MKTAYFLVVLTLVGCGSTTPRIDDAIVNAWNHNRSVPLAHLVDETLTIDRAYRVQTRVVRKQLHGARPAGFKAGLTSAAAQARFRANDAVAGVLMADASRTPNELHLSGLRGLHLETEVAMRVSTQISRPLLSTEELKSHIDGIAPAIELPNLDYQHADQLTAPDIIASNVAAAYFLLGAFAPPTSRDANDVTANLRCDGRVLSSGQARDAMGDQWAAALWLVNIMIEQGWTLEPGQILLTGALGKAIRAQPGECVADFGNWGTIEVRIAH